jgi:hypothetical protein
LRMFLPVLLDLVVRGGTYDQHIWLTIPLVADRGWLTMGAQV